MRVFLLSLVFFLAFAVEGCAQNVKMIKNPYLMGPDSVLMGVVPYRGHIGQFETPEVYESWWQEIMACTNLHVTKHTRDKVKWMYVSYPFRLKGSEDIPELYIGYTMSFKNQIWVVFDGISNSRLVKHEMLHFLMYHNGLTPGHPEALFNKCNVNS
jgi:hypothetical protein